jgi:UDP-glucose 4-epimerase
VRVLVTGGSGYLGGRLVSALAGSDSCVVRIGLRRASPAPDSALDAEVAVTDWHSDESLAISCRGVDAIVHAAGMNAASCRADPVAALEFQGLATARLLRAAIAAGVRRFIYVSTAHVYGAALRGVVDESTCPRPLHPYATSRRAGEDVVLAARADGALQGIVLRLSNSFGSPAQPSGAVECWKLVANDLCRQGVVGGRMVLQTAGQQRRDFIAISEACRAITHFLGSAHDPADTGLFNVGGDWSPTLLELAQFIGSRIEHNMGTRPGIVTGAATDSVGGAEFRYSTARLHATGFVPAAGAAATEMDRLVVSCARAVAAGDG